LNAIPNCAVSGVLGVLPNTLGALQATEVLKIILEIGTVLSGKVLVYDGLHFQTQIIDFSKNPKAVEKGFINGSQPLNKKKNKRKSNSRSFFRKMQSVGNSCYRCSGIE
jgi:adenylyltransferase/sulfurtransferase